MSIDSKLLKNIYRSPQYSAPHLHDEQSCKSFCSLIAEFCRVVVGDKKYQYRHQWCSSDKCIETIDFVGKVLSGNAESEVEEVLWFPEYGSLVLKYKNRYDHNADMVSYVVLGLDEHRFEMHETSQHTSQAMSHKELWVGAKLDDSGIVLQKFKNIFERESRKTGDSRSAAGGKQGHQKTPAFIHALMMQAFECECDDECKCPPKVPKGGFTDCGLHTGKSCCVFP